MVIRSLQKLYYFIIKAFKNMIKDSKIIFLEQVLHLIFSICKAAYILVYRSIK